MFNGWKQGLGIILSLVETLNFVNLINQIISHQSIYCNCFSKPIPRDQSRMRLRRATKSHLKVRRSYPGHPHAITLSTQNCTKQTPQHISWLVLSIDYTAPTLSPWHRAVCKAQPSRNLMIPVFNHAYKNKFMINIPLMQWARESHTAPALSPWHRDTKVTPVHHTKYYHLRNIILITYGKIASDQSTLTKLMITTRSHHGRER